MHSLGKWKYIGVGRDDGVTRGEYSPIFYNTEVHELISWRYFWLSEHPEKPGRGWDAASVRICTVGRFGFKSSDKQTHEFTVLVPSPNGRHADVVHTFRWSRETGERKGCSIDC